MSIDISVIWFVIIVFATLMYIVMDGFDLGIGMLFSVVHDGEERDVMVNSVAPVWDGNETWLVLGGAGLFGAFPLAYAVITDALVIPLTAMLIGLIFRGVAFEFRFKAVPSHRIFWDYAFAGGSLLATFSQGIVVGAFINGFAVADRRFAGSTLDWLTPRELTRKVLLALMVVIAVVSVWMPLGWRYVAERWFTLPNFFWFVPVPILVLALSLWIWRLSARPASHARPFILTLGLIFLGFSGLGISVWPNIIPPHISLWDAAAPPSSQVFMLPGALLIIPVILMYTAWSYYVFRGKVSGSEGYH
ncbi:MAG: cytochrome d ubiquinol oxidase subunit II [Klebsiella pneumoniae]|nr:cytochrome d ubiquinol oxidase subunit II [Klebsiella pneumoniae]